MNAKEIKKMVNEKGIQENETFSIMSRPFENNGVKCTGHCEGHFKFVGDALLEEGTRFDNRFESGFSYTGQFEKVEEVHWGDFNYITE